MKPMVYSGLYPIEPNKFEALREALLKLKLNDASLSFEPETSEALGFGFDYFDKYVKMIDEVTASDIIRVSNKYFNDIYVESTVK